MPVLDLNTLLRLNDINPEAVVVLRNTEPSLRDDLPYIAFERPDLFRAYQQCQGPRLESALKRAKFMASFLGRNADEALFVALYEVGEGTPLSYEEFWAIREHQELRTFGYGGAQPGTTRLKFPLMNTGVFLEWHGRLVIKWPGRAVSWWRWAKRNTFPVEAVLPESFSQQPMPDWKHLVLTWTKLQALPSRWETLLSQWRGVYYIFDVERGLGYVGSACGQDNILGRWLNYASSGHGGNKRLRKSEPKNLRFSILQRTSPDEDPEDVVRLETTWKERLHTREHGLNEN